MKIKRIISTLLSVLCAFSATACGTSQTATDEKITYANKYIDLHLHLDGALPLDIAKKLAKIQNIELPTNDDAELERMLTVPEDCTSLNDFLECFDLPLSLLQTKQGLSEAVYLVAENIKSQGVIYAEIRYAPQLHTDNGMTQEDAILAALDGLKRSDLKANLILCCMRGEGNDAENYETLELAKKYLVAIGILLVLAFSTLIFISGLIVEFIRFKIAALIRISSLSKQIVKGINFVIEKIFKLLN